MFWVLAKGGPTNPPKSDCWWQVGPPGQLGEEIIIQIGSLSSGSGLFGWFYIPLFDNARHRPVSADLGWRRQILAPAGFWRVPQIDSFPIQSTQIIKNGDQRQCQKKTWNYHGKVMHEGVAEVKNNDVLYREHRWKMERKKHAKSIEIEYFGRIGSEFWIRGEVLENVKIDEFWSQQKSIEKLNICKFEAWRSSRPFWGRGWCGTSVAVRA